MKWINFLHIYQPANTDAHIIEEAAEKSYYRIVRALEENPKIKFTLNISGCLLLRLEEMGHLNFIKRIERLMKKGQVELVGTAAYHALLPLVPEEEVKKQIRENEEILRKHFGKNFKPKGFFLPEMAYSGKVAKIIKKMGYKWLMLDEIACSGKLNEVDFNKNYYDLNSGLKIVFRSRKYSKCYVPDLLKEELKEGDKGKKKIFITATDGELYGLRHIDHTAEFEKILKNKNLETETVSEFLHVKREIKKIKIKSCSWESSEEELKKNIPYILWFEKSNKLQQKIWRLAILAYNAVEGGKKDINYKFARWHLVRGLASCTFWWASAKDFRLFGPISWSPDEIEKGINEFIRSIRSLDSEKTRQLKIKAEKLYINIKQEVWNKHWTYYWKK